MGSEGVGPTLGEVVGLIRGTTYKSSLLGQSGPVLLGLGTIQRNGGFRADNLKTYGGDSKPKLLLYPGDLFVSLKDVTQSADLLGAIARVPDSVPVGRLTQDTVKLDFGESAFPRDLIYWTLRSPQFRSYCRDHATGTTNLGLAREDFLAFRLPAASREALWLVEMLESIESRIDNLSETNATLEAIAQALFKSWFVDFDPVHAKAEGRAPEGMDAATAALFPSGFEDSELGQIPKGWYVRPFGSLLANSIGGDWGNEVATDEQTERVAIIRGTDIPDLRSQSDCRVPIRFTTPRKVVGRALAIGDLVVEVSGGSKGQPTGRSLYVTNELLAQFDCSVVPASFCRKFSPATEQIGLLLAQHMDSIYAAGKTWEYQNQSTGIANFQTKHFLANENVVVPSEKVLDAFYKLVGPMVERTQLLHARRLADIRDTLLPRLISGKLRLPEAERDIEAATA